jgi:hypothetical protein
MRTDKVDLVEARAAYFTLLWSVERVQAGRRTIDRGWFRRRPLEFLDQLVRWHVEYWAAYQQEVKQALEAGLGSKIDDSQARDAFHGLVAAVAGPSTQSE